MIKFIFVGPLSWHCLIYYYRLSSGGSIVKYNILVHCFDSMLASNKEHRSPAGLGKLWLKQNLKIVGDLSLLRFPLQEACVNNINSKRKSLFNQVAFVFLIMPSLFLFLFFLTHTHKSVPDGSGKDPFILVCWLQHWPKVDASGNRVNT